MAAFSRPFHVRTALVLAVTLGASPAVAQTKRKVFIDQDYARPTGTDAQSSLALLQSPDVDVVGMTVTAGDGWAKLGTAVALRMLELTGHAQVPLAMGGEFPLVNTREETLHWEQQFGAFGYKGAWNERGYHGPAEVPALEQGLPTTKAVSKHGALLLIETLRRFPGEVTLWVGGPMTTVALAIKLDPDVPALAKELVLMGGGFNVDKGGNHRINGRREFNWWWDPEATRIVMSSNWKKITMTPVDISVKTNLPEASWATIARSSSKTAQYLTKFRPKPTSAVEASGYMWDEIAAVAWLDPSLITKQDEVYVNIDIDHGAGYGQTIFIEKDVKAPAWFWKLATVQWDLDAPRFYKAFVDLMCR